VQIAGSRVYLDGVRVARHIPSAEMIAGRWLVVLFWNSGNTAEAVVIGVYG